MPDQIRFISTRGNSAPCSFIDAMKRGLAPDGGLYVPQTIPELPAAFWNSLSDKNIQQIGVEVSMPFFGDEADVNSISDIVGKAISFDAPLVHYRDNIYILELFHGPTLAFKDFGARFMARAFASLDDEKEGDLLILAATSGDTGSAVADGFYGVEGTRVCLLYPSGKISRLQEQQMTTLGGNVTAIEIDGTFDDCQRMVKEAFSDPKVHRNIRLSSANSINIARLIPQSFYYAHALGRLQELLGKGVKPFFSVPSGNLGNLTAGLLAMKMGMPVSGFLAATNRNDILPVFLQTGKFNPRDSQQTISNAMDVGNPSNFERILYLFNNSINDIRKHIIGKTFSDSQTRSCIKKSFEKTGYVIDPHSAVGLLAAEKYLADTRLNMPFIALATAHPAKFGDVVEKEIGKSVEIPERLSVCLDKQKKSVKMGNEYNTFRDYLLRISITH